ASPVLRRRLHARAAEELLRRGAPAPEIAGHLLRSGAAASADARRVLLEAAKQRSGADPAEATTWLRAALDSGSERCDDTERELAEVLFRSGRLAESRAVWHRLLFRRFDGPPHEKAPLALALSRVEALMGHRAEARALLADLCDELGGGPGTAPVLAASLSLQAEPAWETAFAALARAR
ncbi:hypothetical protein, partial [Actinocorallia lasiicapitis]